MKQARAAGRQWDVVILDPPKLAPNKKALQGATHKYRMLNQLAMQIVRYGAYRLWHCAPCHLCGDMHYAAGNRACIAQSMVLP